MQSDSAGVAISNTLAFGLSPDRIYLIPSRFASKPVVVKIIFWIIGIRHAIISVTKTLQWTQALFKTFKAYIKPKTLTGNTQIWRQDKQTSHKLQLFRQEVIEPSPCSSG